MKWIGISGSWRKTNKEIEEKLRNIVRNIMTSGNGIVSGGALGVDYLATEEAMKHDPAAERIKIFLPTTLKKYSEHYRKHAELGDITIEQAENLIKQLVTLKKLNSKVIIENPDENFTEENKKERYYARNQDTMDASDELVAFRVRTDVSQGLGTHDTVEKARQKGIPVQLFEYDLTT